MLRLKKIAITGGIASGKSAVCQIFQELGAYGVDTDTIVHELLTPDTPVGQQVVRLLGTDILRDGKLSRRKIADKVFKDSETLHALEQILHPAVYEQLEQLYQKLSERYYAFVVEVPLLFEVGWEKLFDVTIAVSSEREICKKRFREAGHSDQEYDLRMKRHFSPEEKAHRADFVVSNNGSLSHLRKQILTITREVFSS